MLNDLLKDYLKAVKENDQKTAHKLKKQLNKIGVDDYTIYILTGVK